MTRFRTDQSVSHLEQQQLANRRRRRRKTIAPSESHNQINLCVSLSLSLFFYCVESREKTNL